MFDTGIAEHLVIHKAGSGNCSPEIPWWFDRIILQGILRAFLGTCPAEAA